MFRHVSAYGWWFDATWPSQGLPRGTFILVYGCYVKLLESVGFDPRTSLHTTPSQRPSDQRTINCALLYIQIHIYLSLKFVTVGGGSGRGLAPARGRLIAHMTIPYIYCITDSWCMGFLKPSPWFYVIHHMPTTGAGSWHGCNRLAPFAIRAGHMTPHTPRC
jgi:hypothetical protein